MLVSVRPKIVTLKIDSYAVKRSSDARINRHFKGSPVGKSGQFIDNKLTSRPGLPVEQTLFDAMPTKLLTGGGVLIVALKPADDENTLLLGKEAGSVGKVLDNEERDDSCYDCSKTF